LSSLSSSRGGETEEYSAIRSQGDSIENQADPLDKK
jgi:hypothetical protein